jgi:predicted transcriptional regulator of viral defense system
MCAMELHAALAPLAARQHGLFTTAQALDAGFTEWALRRNLRSGAWIRVRHGVLAVGGSPVTWERSLLAAVLATAPDAVASHDAAAELWDLPDVGARALEVTTNRPSWVRQPGVRSHRTTTFLREEHTSRRAIPVTTVARTLVDIFGRYSVEQLGSAVDHALRSSTRSRWWVDAAVSTSRIRKSGWRSRSMVGITTARAPHSTPIARAKTTS